MMKAEKNIQNEEVWLISKYAVLPIYGPPNRQYFISKFLNQLNFSCRLITSRSCAFAKLPSFFGVSKSYIDPSGLPYTVLNGPTIDLGFSKKRLFSWLIFEFALLIYALRRFRSKPKIIYVSSLSILTFLTGTLLKKLFKCKLIVEVRDIWPATLVDIGGYNDRSLVVKFLRLVERIGYKHADLIIGSMPRLDAHVKQIIDQDFEFLCVPMGYDPGFYQLDPPQKGTDARFDSMVDKISSLKAQHQFNIVYCGTIGKANFVEDLLEAALLLDNDFGVFIIGNGPLKEELENKYKRANIYFLGIAPKKLLPSILQEFDLLVNMWGDKEIYKYGVSPNKWIDYMLSKRPLLISYNGYQSIVNEAGCGWFIKARDPILLSESIRRIARDVPSEEMAAMGLKGYKYVTQNLNYITLSKIIIAKINKLS